MPRKPDAAQIEAFLEELPRELHLEGNRRSWPEFIYRFDDVRTVASILLSGTLLSRDECARRGIAHHDAANRQIIEQTQYAHKWVRLYFRPMTPTQYRMEGIRAKEQIPPTGEHCPVPVFLMFDSKTLLGEAGVYFTNGSAARPGRFEIGDTADFLGSLPFESIYHHGPMDAAERDEVVFRRQAEVLIEREMPLDALRYVVCRVGPERDTLLYLLNGAAARWAPQIRLAQPGAQYFFRSGMFVESVRLIEDKVLFNVPMRALKYELDLMIHDASTGRELLHKSGNAGLPRSWQATLPGRFERVRVRLTIEGALAFQGILSQQAVFA